MEKQTITIYDVAREANVSMATVSRVVNGNPNVRPDTREKVLKVIEKLDYRPNAVARGLASHRTTTVGVLIPDLTNIFYASLARGIDDVATMYKYNIILASADAAKGKVNTVLESILAKQVDGLIFMGQNLQDSTRKELERSKTPVVLSGTVDPQNKLGSVNIDYVAAIREATQRLISTGNEHVAFVTGALDDPINGQFRLKGYQEALADAKIPYDESLVFETEYSYRAGEAIWDAVKRSGATAAVITDDELAVGFLNGANDSHVRIPEDFEIITSNNTMLTEIVRPKLTSIAQPLYDIGAVAMRLLTKMMNKEEIEQKTVLLPHSIITRNSTK
ncbi:catabolite control protein A [Lapidilactobacillus wuchangensis]|uniref:catabolite control protein A n=1 Tax=Lapidilactobacillus wuchangensis TaxID=2486001 RepID=UPI000F795A70|nr:catabolite control protein A [Lapidilactobacillus wuchangensis]